MAQAKSLILNLVTLILVALLAGSTVYFYLKSQEKSSSSSTKQSTTSGNDNDKDSNATDSADSQTTTKTTEDTENITKPAASSDHPSNPAKTYTIASGETLSAISAKLNMNWTRLAEVNNITNSDMVKEGDIIIVPSYNEKTKKLYLEFTVDTQKAAQIQDQAASDATSIYLDPAATAKSDAVGFYGLADTDTFSFVSKNELDGTAIVNVVHGDKNYVINLIQPTKKGKDGIWAISTILPK